MKYYIAVDDIKGLNQYISGVKELVVEKCEMVSETEIIRPFLYDVDRYSGKCEVFFEEACYELLVMKEEK